MSSTLRKILMVLRAECFSPNAVEKDAAVLHAVGRCLESRGAQVEYIREEQLSAADGAIGSDVVELIERVVLPAANLNSWNVRQNQLTLNVTLDTLQDTNMLAQILNEEDMVEFATVKNAVTNEIKREPAPSVSGAPNAEPPAEEAAEAEEPAEGEAMEVAPTEEAPAEQGEVPEEPAEGEAEGEAEAEGKPEEEKELLYNVTAQIIVYLTIAEKEG